MFESSSTTLKISISYKNPAYTIDSVPGHNFEFEAGMSDASVHAWFEIFEKVLAYQGFSAENICAGGCQLAFNEYREPGLMQKTAKDYDLILIEYSESEEDSTED